MSVAVFASFHILGSGNGQSVRNGSTIVAAPSWRRYGSGGQEVKPSAKLTATIKDSVELARLMPVELQR